MAGDRSVLDGSASPGGIDTIGALVRGHRGARDEFEFARRLNAQFQKEADASPRLRAAAARWAAPRSSQSDLAAPDAALRRVHPDRFEFTSARIHGWEDEHIRCDDTIAFLGRAMGVPLTEMLRRFVESRFVSDARHGSVSRSASTHGEPVRELRRALRAVLCPIPLDLPCRELALRVVASDGVGVVRRVSRAVAAAGYTIRAVSQASSSGSPEYALNLVVHWEEPQSEPPAALDGWDTIESAIAKEWQGDERAPSVTAFPLYPEACHPGREPVEHRGLQVQSVSRFLRKFGKRRGWARGLYNHVVRQGGNPPDPSTIYRWAEARSRAKAPTLSDAAFVVLLAAGATPALAVAMILRSQARRGAKCGELVRLLRQAASPANPREKSWSLWIIVSCPDRRGLLADLAGVVADNHYSIVHLAQGGDERRVTIFLQVRATERSRRRSPNFIQRHLLRAVGSSTGADAATVAVWKLGQHSAAPAPTTTRSLRSR